MSIIDFLTDQGFEVDSSPNSKISEEQLAMLLKEFADSALDKEEASGLTIGTKNADNLVIRSGQGAAARDSAEEDRILIKDNVADNTSKEKRVDLANNRISGPNIVGKIDLDAAKRGKAAPVEEKPKQESETSTPQVIPESVKEKAESLLGLKVLGKIELPPDKKAKPVAASDENKVRKKRPRKRIATGDGSPKRENRPGGKVQSLENEEHIDLAEDGNTEPPVAGKLELETDKLATNLEFKEDEIEPPIDSSQIKPEEIEEENLIPRETIRELSVNEDIESHTGITKPPSIGKEDIQRQENEVGFEAGGLQKILDALNIKKQIILQGPPGTGKTFIARIIANLKTSKKEENIRFIQFHPNYTYEDFIEGYRFGGSQGTYMLEDGIFKSLCLQASQNEENDYVIIIDEINRGNLSSIFGELLMTLEYRDTPIILPYSKKEFWVPQNVFIIGTMNTADRSLALIDFATRRRFRFIDLLPQYKSLLKYLEKNECVLDAPQLVSNLEDLNNKILSNQNLGKNYLVGISFFCIPLLNLESLQSIWDMEIHPLLEEYFYDSDMDYSELKQSFLQGL